MKVVINTSYGSIPKEIKEKRYDVDFIKEVEDAGGFGLKVKDDYCDIILKTVEVPDYATDFRIVNYDGVEGVIYCYNGKIYFTGAMACALSIFEDGKPLPISPATAIEFEEK